MSVTVALVEELLELELVRVIDDLVLVVAVEVVLVQVEEEVRVTEVQVAVLTVVLVTVTELTVVASRLEMAIATEISEHDCCHKGLLSQGLEQP